MATSCDGQEEGRRQVDVLGPERKVGLSFPAAMQTEQVRGLSGEGWVGPRSCLHLLPSSQPHGCPRDSAESGEGKRVSKGFIFPKGDGSSPSYPPPAEGQDPARQVGWWGRTQGRRLLPGACRTEAEISTQPGCWLRLGSWEGLHIGLVTSGWWAGLQLRRLRKLIYLPAPSHTPQE